MTDVGGGPDRGPLVVKFGGSAFADLGGYTRVARYTARRIAEEQRPVVVVVSAMSGTTGRLQQTLDVVADTPPPQVCAMLLTSGETVSVALLTAALDAAGVPALPLSAAGTGLLGEGPADRARLIRADPEVPLSALADHPVVVVPGGQAVDADGGTVMLGRNSSDLSAAAMAAALGAGTCVLFSDVPGVCTADPYLVPAARTLPEISYEGVRRMSRHGAKVVHESAVDWAERGDVRLHCRPFPWTASDGAGTVVGQGTEAAAVVAHKSSDVWRFRSGRERRAAARGLLAEGLRGTEFDSASGTYLVVPGAVRGAAHHLLAARRHDDLCLITSLRADGRAEHVLVSRADADAEARRCHALLYPDPVTVAGPAAPARAKRRSPHSDVLSGPPPVPVPGDGAR
ncbi:aspartate kinase [Streptomyces sp. A1136]|uniref:amino acid kinase family protein n=1 Tax=Streptomyces sp. A1136 TaxID=2563102 RepID=UPI0014457E8C|nr:aspartate kinase [Streptomyces sp. A1136]